MLVQTYIRKKRLEFEAVLLTLENSSEVKKWCNGATWSNPPMRAVTGIQIQNIRGGFTNVFFGEYVIKQSDGSYTFDTQQHFEETYEPIT